ncbi:hypothetical protein Anas_13621 [Armadillidium nasatum]|uniref:BHLH domain-containing protein n=1 Tax=Armadillidium nasatum TaxID=96803 RepID=A0A5N5T6J9_9CRUS|nr:hypothetical protein Anas_13621 [Armadillidium nasatum]
MDLVFIIYKPFDKLNCFTINCFIMKAIKCERSVESYIGVIEGKVSKMHIKDSSKGNESSQLLSYLEHLQEIVPHCPKSRPLSKLQVIQSVIDYIYDLEDILEEADAEEGNNEDRASHCDQYLRSESSDEENPISNEGFMSLWQIDDVYKPKITMQKLIDPTTENSILMLHSSDVNFPLIESRMRRRLFYH